MDWKKLALGALLGGSMVLGGCGDDDGPAPATDGGMVMTDGGTMMLDGDDIDCGTENANCFYVANALGVPSQDDDRVDGFNLDGRIDTEQGGQCMNQSPADFIAPDGREGIDNSLAGILTAVSAAVGDITDQIDEAIGGGSVILLLETDGLDNENDDDVTLNMYLGALECDDMCADEGNCIQAGKTFDINDDSFMAGSQTPLISVGATATALASGTQIGGGPTNIGLNLPISEELNLNLNIRSANVRFDRNEAGNSLENGVIGGSLNADELRTAIMAIPEAMEFAALIETVLSTYTDLPPIEDGECTAISVGITFGAVNAVRGEVQADDACGMTGGGEG